jgi:membrane-bound lytic murein transglycosylase D
VADAPETADVAAASGPHGAEADGSATDGSGTTGDAHPQAIAELTPPTPNAPSPDDDFPLPEPAADEEEVPADAGAPLVAVAAEADAGSEVEAEASEPAELLADPSDYSVASDGTIEVQANETLGHYAEWLGIRASRLRSINRLAYGQNLDAHSRLKLDFTRVDPGEFERRRLHYHRSLQEEFFSEWEIAGTETHRLRRGDSLWVLSHRRFNVPIWLLQQYNPDVDFESSTAGTRITVPLLKRREWMEGAQNAGRPPGKPLS